MVARGIFELPSAGPEPRYSIQKIKLDFHILVPSKDNKSVQSKGPREKNCKSTAYPIIDVHTPINPYSLQADDPHFVMIHHVINIGFYLGFVA